MQKKNDYSQAWPNAQKLPGINPVGYGREKCESGFSVSTPRPYWMVHFVVSGKGTFTNEKGTFAVMPMQMFVVHPHRVHCYTADSEDPWEYIWVNFDGNFPIPALFEQDVITLPAASRIFSEIISVDNTEAGSAEYICCKMWELFSLLAKAEHKSDFKQNAYVEAAKSIISENYSGQVMVSDIAKSLSLDRTYFSTLFKAETGLSPKQYLAKFRLEKAAELLVSGSSVSDAAALCGYSDTVNFSRMFKRHFSVSPMRYRTKLLEEELELHRKKENG